LSICETEAISVGSDPLGGVGRALNRKNTSGDKIVLDSSAERPARQSEPDPRSAASEIVFRRPSELDGPQVTALIADCPPLDVNSAYCNLLQCSHFADTCVVAERAGQIVGWISGYRPPSAPG